MAESVLGMMLHFARGFDHAVRAQARREWGKRPFEEDLLAAREVAGAVCGILGLGGIGREVAARARALGMAVVAVRRRPEPGPAGVELLHGEGALAELLERSDYVVITVPSTAATRGLVGAAELARLRPGTVLINVARGDVVDEAALADALRSGRLRGAGLDVFSREPLPPESPLWDLDNVLITPHVSGTTPRFWRREMDLVVANVGRYLRGEPLRNQVDKQLGY
jgi:phosphoglycerate dehydrogenase-like enzyme